MKNLVLLNLIFVVSFLSCSKTATNESLNSSDVNLVIGIADTSNLQLVFNTLNELKFDILQMNHFNYISNTPKSEVSDLIDYFNTKSYIRYGAWQATPSSVYFIDKEGKTRILNQLHLMNLENQRDWLKTIDSLGLVTSKDGLKSISLGIPIGREKYWKEKMKDYSFVTWTETFYQVCISYEHAFINSVNLPSNGKINQKIPVTIGYMITNGCGGFGNYVESKIGNTITLKLNAKYEGCICTQNIQNIQTTYDYVSSISGLNYLKVEQPDGSIITKTITLN